MHRRETDNLDYGELQRRYNEGELAVQTAVNATSIQNLKERLDDLNGKLWGLLVLGVGQLLGGAGAVTWFVITHNTK